MKKKVIFKNLIFTTLTFIIATIFALIAYILGDKHSANITLIYILALIVIVHNTSGYLYGILAALYFVIVINYCFTYPYFEFNFTMVGYPLTFFIMLLITLFISTMVMTLKKHQILNAQQAHQLEEREKEQIHANLLRAVSHDLRTPLTSIIGSSSTYLEDYSNMCEEDRLEIISSINEDAQWLLNMVENLLTVSKIRKDSQEVTKTLEVVEEVVSESIIRIQKRLPDIKIHVSMPDNFLMVPMDFTLIEQVLINLLENAYVHSSSSNPIHLTITETTDFVMFSVRDYGIGISSEKLEHIFDGDSKFEASNTHKGIGIGLSICRTIIYAHKGNLNAKNHADGAEFYFSLPKEKESFDYV